MADDNQGSNQGNGDNAPSKPQSYGTNIVQKSDPAISKPLSYGTHIITEDANNRNR